MAIEVIQPGLLTTVQDTGRLGHAADGYPECGACDKESFMLANILAGNIKDDAALECSYTGPVIRFTENAVAAVIGSRPLINGLPVPAGLPLFICAGSILDTGRIIGARAYIALHGGILTCPVLGSRSTDLYSHIGGFEGRALKAGDILPVLDYNALTLHRMLMHRAACGIYMAEQTGTAEIHVIPGPQDDMFTAEEQSIFYSNVYTVSADSNRMGIRLSGAPVTCGRATDILSDAVAEGSVQISANGLPIIMMADHQTTGGYAKIATVIPTDIPVLAQLTPGCRIRFIPSEYEHALAVYREHANKLAELTERMTAHESGPEFGPGRELRRVHNRTRRGYNKVCKLSKRSLRLPRR